MRVYLDTVGCRLNQSEIERLAANFRASGHEIVASASQADIVVINTCAVTAEAASDSRQKIRQAARQGAGQIIVTGCWATLEPAEAAALPRVSRVVPNAEKMRLVADLIGTPLYDIEPIAREPLPGAHRRTRAFIKVQDGCDNFCTFCITRVARGKGRSESVEQVVREVQAALAGGAKEVVLSGVHLGSWGQDLRPPRHLRHLIEMILKETDVPRLRLSSLEPWDLDEAFFGLWENPRLCRHLHLPLQSGCAQTLRRMARKVTPEGYAALLEQARRAIPGLAVTTDIIVGFPGENDTEFETSLKFVEAMAFAGGHVFAYSPRPGTPAARLPGQVPPSVKKERSRRMREVLSEASLRFRQSFLGADVQVLWETTDGLGPQGWRLRGLSDNYLHVEAFAPEPLWNQISQVRLVDLNAQGMVGQILVPITAPP